MSAKIELFGRVERYIAWALYLHFRPSIATQTQLMTRKTAKVSIEFGFCLAAL